MDGGKEKKYNQAMVNRIARATGHLKMVRKMVEEGRDCSEVLIQLAAVKSAINGMGKEILKLYIDQCMEEEIREQDHCGIQKAHKGIDTFVK